MHYCRHCCAAFRNEILRCPLDGNEVERSDVDPLVGQLIGSRYRVLSVIGRGGMGQVYKTVHEMMGKPFAVKVLYGDLAADARMLQRFRREAQAASRLEHHHIVSVVDFGRTDEGLLYLAMELLDGRDLAEVIRKEAPLGLSRALHIARGVALGLAHAHEKGLIHRDLKPENVMLLRRDEDRDFVKILDFGLARLRETGPSASSDRLTTVGVVFGTPEYIAPEQAMGRDVDPRADIYSLGAILFHMLSARLPYEADNPIEYLTQHVTAPIPSLADLSRTPPVPAAVDTVVRWLLAKRQEERPASARALVAILDDLAPEVRIAEGEAPILVSHPAYPAEDTDSFPTLLRRPAAAGRASLPQAEPVAPAPGEEEVAAPAAPGAARSERLSTAERPSSAEVAREVAVAGAGEGGEASWRLVEDGNGQPSAGASATPYFESLASASGERGRSTTSRRGFWAITTVAILVIGGGAVALRFFSGEPARRVADPPAGSRQAGLPGGGALPLGRLPAHGGHGTAGDDGAQPRPAGGQMGPAADASGVASPGAAAAIDASVASPGPDRSSPHARPVPEAHPTTATTPAGHRPVAPLLARNEALEAEARSLTARLVQELARRNISQADLGFDESVAPLYHRYLVSKRGRDPAAKTESTRLLLASLDGFRMDRQLLARKLTRIAQDVRLLADAAPEAASPLEARLYSAEDKLKSGLGGDPQRQRAFSEELDGLWGEVSRALRAAGRHRSASRAAR